MYDNLKKNTFAFSAYEYTESNNHPNEADYLYDTKGYNTFFVETMSIRYRRTTNQYYNPEGSRKTYFGMFISMGDEIADIQIRTTSVTDYQDLISNIYPNPATTRLTIDLNEAGNANVTIYNILGQAIIEETLNDISNSINIAELSSGLYFVKVNQNGRNHTVKISKE
jgi:hypothetical protein